MVILLQNSLAKVKFISIIGLKILRCGMINDILDIVKTLPLQDYQEASAWEVIVLNEVINM